MYSDGITETTNSRGEEFGTNGIIEVVQANRNATSKEICDQIFQAVEEFSDFAIPKDDRTVFIVKKD